MPSTPDYPENMNMIFHKPFLPSYNNISVGNTALPLWSTRSMFDKKYLQVEVFADHEVPFEKSTDVLLNMNKYTCHICNTEVPKSYINEHNDGEKHKTCMKIADIAMERARKHMASNIKETSLSIHVTETYFCEPCALVVQKVDKITHESSETHAKSIKSNGILKDFLMIYEDKDNIDLVMQKCSQSDTVEDYVELTKIDESVDCKNVPTNDDLNEPNEVANDNIKVIIKPETEPVIVTAKPNITTNPDIQPEITKDLLKYVSEDKNPVKKADNKQNSHKTSTKLDYYLATVSEKCNINPIHTVKALTDKLILITALNGDKIKVPVTSFHSIHNQKDKSYCKICEDPNVGYRHEYSEEHMEKLMIPIEDKNAIRKIDDIWSHCIMCNDLTKNINFHLQSLLHKNKLKHCLVETGTDINENIVVKANPHKEDTSQLIQEHSLIISHDSSEITCNICVITIPNKGTSIKNHIKEFEHITNYNKVIEQNKLNELDDSQYYCIPCDMCVAKCYTLGHCKGKKHKKNLTDLLNKENVTTIEECTQIILPSISQQIKRINTKSDLKSQNNSNLICFVCNVVLYHIDTHMNSLEHKKSYFSYLEANKLNEIEEDTFYCIPCNTVILIDYLMNHCTSKKHKTHLKNFINNAENKELQFENTGQLIAENSHISRSITRSVQHHELASTSSPTPDVCQNGIFETAIPLKFLYQFREMTNSRKLLCTICDEEISYKKYDIQTHVNMIDHIVAFNLMMLWNKIKRLNDKYYCDTCKVEVTYFNELSHITSSQHVAVMAEQPKGTVYEYDKRLLTLEYAMSHKVGDRVKPSFLISVSKPTDSE